MFELKTRSATGLAPLNLVGGYRFSNPTEIEADGRYICATEACLLRDEPRQMRRSLIHRPRSVRDRLS